MPSFFEYNADGAIVVEWTCPDSMIERQVSAGNSYLRSNGKSGESHYVDLNGPSIVERASIDPSVSTSSGEATLSGLPDPTTVKWSGQQAEATGGEATVQVDEPGTYTLTLEAGVEYLDTEIKVEIP